jgi:drug/metabolite transporter (DMT)-like permease
MDLHQPTGRRALGLGLASCTMALWGVLPLALEQILAELDPITITWFRFGFSASCMLAWLGSTGALPKMSGLPGSVWTLLGVSTAGLAANYLAYLLGLHWTSPANAQVLIQAAPLLLALGGILVFRERFTPAQWAGFGVLVAGIGLFFGSQLSALAGEVAPYLSGVAMIGLAAVTWAIYGLAQKQLLRSLTSRQIMLLIYSGCFVIFSVGARPAGLAELGTRGWVALWFVSANTLVAYGAFAAALAHWQASRVSAVLALTPLATLGYTALGAALLPALVEPESIGVFSVLGALAVVVGSLVVSLGGRD